MNIEVSPNYKSLRSHYMLIPKYIVFQYDVILKLQNAFLVRKMHVFRGSISR